MLDMGRTPCCDKQGLKRGSWTEEEDQKLVSYIRQHGEGGWRCLPEKAGLLRCGKSCRLRWANYLRPGIKRGEITPEEEQTIIRLHSVLGNRWSTIARHLYKRTDNEIKNYWNTRLKRRVAEIGSSTCSPSSGATITTVDHHVADQDQTGIISIPSGITDQNLANPDHDIMIFDDSLQVENKQGAILSSSTPTRSSNFGPSVSSPSNTSSDFDQVSRPASSSARILLNKIASSKLTLLNLPRVVIHGGGGGGGGRGESQVEGTNKGNNVAELSSCGGCDSGSLASSRPSNVDPLDSASPAQQSTGFSAFCADNIDDLEQYWLSGTSE